MKNKQDFYEFLAIVIALVVIPALGLVIFN